MTFAFGFHPEAQAEFTADVEWYDARDRDMGGRFADAVRAAVDAVVEAPGTWPTWPGWEREPVIRSKGVSGFPYRVVYLADDNAVTIVAVAHAKRRPGYWRARAGV
jgi:toxin ParE1/3/4